MIGDRVTGGLICLDYGEELQRGAPPEAKIVKSSSSCDNLAENIYYMLHKMLNKLHSFKTIHPQHYKISSLFQVEI